MLYTSNLVIGLEKGLDDTALLLEAADATQTGVEFFLHAHSASYREKAAQIGTWLGDRPRTTHGPFIQVEAASPAGSSQHAYMLEAYRYAYGVAKELGSRHLVFHTHQRMILAQEKEAAQDMCKTSIEELLAMGERHGVTLLLENLGIQKVGVSLFDEDEFIHLVKSYPQAGCLIDAGHLNVAGWNAEHVLRELRGRIVGYHLHNNDGVSDTHCRVLDGTLDYERFMALYRRYTPDADITLEYADDHGITAQDLIDDLSFIRERMQ